MTQIHTNPEIQELEREIARHKAALQRMIAQGSPSQGAEDRLRKLERDLLRIRQQATQA